MLLWYDHKHHKQYHYRGLWLPPFAAPAPPAAGFTATARGAAVASGADCILERRWTRLPESRLGPLCMYITACESVQGA